MRRLYVSVPFGWTSWPLAKWRSDQRVLHKNAAGDGLTSLTVLVWNAPSEPCTGSATMTDAWLNRRRWCGSAT